MSDVSKNHPNAPVARKVTTNSKTGKKSGTLPGGPLAQVNAGGSTSVGGRKTGPKK